MSNLSQPVPMHIINGREHIAMQDCVEDTAVMAFVKRFPNYWVFDPVSYFFIGPPKEPPHGS